MENFGESSSFFVLVSDSDDNDVGPSSLETADEEPELEDLHKSNARCLWLAEKLGNRIFDNQITEQAGRDLLAILRDEEGMEEKLPKDPRTLASRLLGTSNLLSLNIRHSLASDIELDHTTSTVYIGVGRQLQFLLQKYPNFVGEVKICFNIDGLDISSKFLAKITSINSRNLLILHPKFSIFLRNET